MCSPRRPCFRMSKRSNIFPDYGCDITSASGLCGVELRDLDLILRYYVEESSISTSLPTIPEFTRPNHFLKDLSGTTRVDLF